jgi:hypothetical protein
MRDYSLLLYYVPTSNYLLINKLYIPMRFRQTVCRRDIRSHNIIRVCLANGLQAHCLTQTITSYNLFRRCDFPGLLQLLSAPNLPKLNPPSRDRTQKARSDTQSRRPRRSIKSVQSPHGSSQLQVSIIVEERRTPICHALFPKKRITTQYIKLRFVTPWIYHPACICARRCQFFL